MVCAVGLVSKRTSRLLCVVFLSCRHGPKLSLRPSLLALAGLFRFRGGRRGSDFVRKLAYRASRLWAMHDADSSARTAGIRRHGNR